ncbi:MAG: hypothetical protein JWQ64_285 [Subtercola sp.]|nr:hypothetical protein [Subtercola sp.]
MSTWIRRAPWGVLGLAVTAALVAGGTLPAATADTGPTPSSSPTVAANPSLEAQNDAHDHVLGATMTGDAPAPTASVPTPSQPSAAAHAQAIPQAVPSSRILGFDVSSFQPNVDWSAAYDDGARFVYIKATESFNSTNDLFQSQWNAAGTANLVRGAYHFAVPFESSGATQAAYFVAHGGTWTPDGTTLPPVVDMETNPYGNVDGNICYDKTPAQMASWIADFSNTVLARTGIRPTVYTNPNFWQTCMAGNKNFVSNPLFIANWTYNVASGPGTLPASWSTYVFWQYADDGGTPLFPGDQDVFNGDSAALKRFATNTTLDGNYITALYEDYLDRLPSQSDIDWWSASLANGAPRSSISAGFVNSDEYRLIRIDAAYQSVLGRPAEQAGRLNWLDAMRSGGITTDDIETSLYASEEYFQQHGDNNLGFVTSLYQTLLHRQGSASDYAFWSNLIVQHGRAWVIAQYWDANETISERVSAMYQLYLGRVPDPAGLKTWVNVALQIGDTGLRAGFTSSDEYYARAQTRTF